MNNSAKVFESPVTALFVSALMSSPSNLTRAAALVLTNDACHGAGIKQIREYCAAVLAAYPTQDSRPALHNMFEIIQVVNDHLNKAPKGQDIGAVTAPQKKFLAPPTILSACRQSALEKGQQLAPQFSFTWKGTKVKCLSWNSKKGEMWVDTPLS